MQYIKSVIKRNVRKGVSFCCKFKIIAYNKKQKTIAGLQYSVLSENGSEREKYYILRKARNDEADQLYSKMLEEATDGLYMLDIMRGGIRNDDPRIPRNVSK